MPYKDPEKLEQSAGVGQQKEVWLVVVREGTGKPSKAALEAAKAEYKAKHPDWQGRDFNVIWIMNEHAKELTEYVGRRLIGGASQEDS